MCGIAGIISKGRKIQLPELKQMTDAIRHRGPDGEGHWIDKEDNIGFGHRRLSILDLSENGKQPMHYDEGNLTITFNGEIYNYIELKNELEQKGYQFISESDTEVVLAAYKEYGPKMLGKMDGMFAMAIWDKRSKQLFCARDRFGEKPFFYSFEDGNFVFASELKAIFNTRGILKTPSKSKIFYYLTYNVLDTPENCQDTFFEKIKKLEPGHFLLLNSDWSLKIEKYWDIDLSKKIDISFEEATEKFQSLFISSIERRLRSDVPVGSSLSGGLDSSSIVRVIDSIRDGNHVQNTFSARFKNYDKDEGVYIKKVVDGTRIKDHHIWVDSEYLLENFKKIYYHQEEPFGTTSIIAQNAVMQLAKEKDVTVLLDGQGADEYLAGYVKRYYKTHLLELSQKGNGIFERERQAFLEMHGIPIKGSSGMRIDKLKKQFSNFIKSTSFKKIPNQTIINKSLAQEKNAVKDPFQYFMKLDDQLKFSIKYQLIDLLRYADRNSMAFSREIRLPFLNHDLVEFVFSLPNHYKLHEGWSKYILRKSMSDYLPEDIGWRKEKAVFNTPQKKWSGHPKFKALMDESKVILKDHKIINEKTDPRFDWQYLMTGLLFE